MTDTCHVAPDYPTVSVHQSNNAVIIFKKFGNSSSKTKKTFVICNAAMHKIKDCMLT